MANMNKIEISFADEKKKPLKIGSSEFISANDFSLKEEEIDKARKELSETEGKKSRSIKELRNKLANNKDVNYRTDEDYLLRYLRVRKFDCDKAYRNIKAARSFREKHQEILCLPTNLKSLLKLNIFSYLPYVDEDGRIVVFMNVGKWNTEETSFVELMQSSHAVLDIISMNPRCQINGVVAIWDTKGINTYHVAQTLSNISVGSLIYFMQSYYPIRLKKVLVINTSRLARMGYKIIRPFVSKKISERIFLLGSDVDELHQHVNPALLPKVLGGLLEEDQYDVTENVLDNLSYLKYERSFD